MAPSLADRLKTSDSKTAKPQNPPAAGRRRERGASPLITNLKLESFVLAASAAAAASV